jgi:hypothetical protein
MQFQIRFTTYFEQDEYSHRKPTKEPMGYTLALYVNILFFPQQVYSAGRINKDL